MAGNNSLFSLSPVERLSVMATAVLAVVALVSASVAYAWSSTFVLAFALGSIGGLVHELFQSGGKILFFVKKEDGLYMGALAGMVLGGVSGIIAARSIMPVDAAQLQSLAYDTFLAGVGMKGLAEAAAGSAVSKAGTAPATGGPASLPAAPATVAPAPFS